jgi:VWFA-related protein
MMRSQLLATALALLAVSGSAQTQSPPARQLRILSPAADMLVSGPTTIRIAIEPAGAVGTVVFFADGRQICSVTAAPLQCYWDAGTAVVAHQVRVVVTLGDGERLVETVRTRDKPTDIPIFSVGVDAVPLTVTVPDGNKRFVKGLTRSAFHVFEDGVPQQIEQFWAEGAPLELVVAVDVSASMAPAMPALKSAVKQFMQGLPPDDPVTLLAFNQNVFDLANPSTPPEARLDAIDRLTAGGATSLYDVIIRAVERASTKSGRKIVVVFTDGEDEGSRASFADAELRLATSEVTLYMVGQGRGVELENLKKVMTRLVFPTGGRAFFTNRIDELRGAFADIVNELSDQYLLAYIPTNRNRDDRWRRIRVVVDGHRDVRTRQSYRLPGD